MTPHPNRSDVTMTEALDELRAAVRRLEDKKRRLDAARAARDSDALDPEDDDVELALMLEEATLEKKANRFRRRVNQATGKDSAREAFGKFLDGLAGEDEAADLGRLLQEAAATKRAKNPRREAKKDTESVTRDAIDDLLDDLDSRDTEDAD